jgi:putative ABC transport system substrate-binding protein
MFSARATVQPDIPRRALSAIGKAVAVATVALALPAAPLAAKAQPTAKTVHIGILALGSPPDPYVEGLRERLRELGYIEGQNVGLEFRWAAGRPERLRDLAAELTRLKVDVIVAGGGTAGVQAVKSATTTIPIVMPVVADPVSSGLVESLERPGGNVTGLALPSAQLSATRLRLFKEAVPRISRIAVVWNPPYPTHGPELRQLETTARSLRVRLQPLEVWVPEHLEIAFAAMRSGYANAVVILASPMHYLHLRRIADLAIKSRLPAASDFREFADAGGLLSYGPSLPDLYRRSATYVDKILKGANPADLPIEQPTKFELVVNAKTARALGITISRSLLVRADQVIQ